MACDDVDSAWKLFEPENAMQLQEQNIAIKSAETVADIDIYVPCRPLLHENRLLVASAGTNVIDTKAQSLELS